ncbi:MAG TPA: DUF1015 domain-containing protein [Phycisphaerales bacterium]|nr:DUF1015 domain-containing protein [Phycisphaerales bacterium]
MPEVFPFRAIHFAAPREQSALVAPPYDVLDGAGKQRLLAKDPRNIVGIDLPHTPAKELGPPGAYEAAGDRFRAFLADGTLVRTVRPVMFGYRQTWTQSSPGGETTISRSGMACCLETVPFGPRQGGGVLPHEETFSGPKEDRLALMRATRAQLSPIFGLHADEWSKASTVLAGVMASRDPDRTARTDDGTLHEVWTVSDAPTIAAYREGLAGEDVFVADGHHRYNTALNYLRELEAKGRVPPEHPARRTMFVLVGMSDPGLVIWPTHRVLGGMRDYTFDRFLNESGLYLQALPVAGGLESLDEKLLASTDPSVLGLYDFSTGRAALASPVTADPLAGRFRDKAPAWRALSVAFIQHVIVEQICQPRLNGGQPVKWAFPHTIAEVAAIGAGEQTGASTFTTPPQLAIIVRPTPLAAVRDVSRAGQLMPQKSTFFYPKLATGLFVHGLAES